MVINKQFVGMFVVMMNGDDKQSVGMFVVMMNDDKQTVCNDFCSDDEW